MINMLSTIINCYKYIRDAKIDQNLSSKNCIFHLETEDAREKFPLRQKKVSKIKWQNLSCLREPLTQIRGIVTRSGISVLFVLSNFTGGWSLQIHNSTKVGSSTVSVNLNKLERTIRNMENTETFPIYFSLRTTFDSVLYVLYVLCIAGIRNRQLPVISIEILINQCSIGSRLGIRLRTGTLHGQGGARTEQGRSGFAIGL